LITRGVIERTQAGRYQVTDAGNALIESGKKLAKGPKGPIPRKQPRQNSFRQRVWSAARMENKFTVPGLLPLCRRDDDKDAVRQAYHYLRGLAQAGYFHVIGKGGSHGPRRYLLLRDSGPLSPILHRNGVVYDPNTRATHTPAAEVVS
jgi:hypothetical protein